MEASSNNVSGDDRAYSTQTNEVRTSDQNLPNSLLASALNLGVPLPAPPEMLPHGLPVLHESWNIHDHRIQNNTRPSQLEGILGTQMSDLERRNLFLRGLQLVDVHRLRSPAIASMAFQGFQREEFLQRLRLQQQLQNIGQVTEISTDGRRFPGERTTTIRIGVEALLHNRLLQAMVRERELTDSVAAQIRTQPEAGAAQTLFHESEEDLHHAPGARVAGEHGRSSSAGIASSQLSRHNTTEQEPKVGSGDVSTADCETANDKMKMVPMELDSDKDVLSNYQCLIRKHVCFFEATIGDVGRTSQGRNRRVSLKQVGVICKHCASIESSKRPRGAVYFPAKVAAVYQAAQNMVTNHFLTSCKCLPEKDRETMRRLKGKKETVWGGGKSYWTHGANSLGVVDHDGSLVFGKKKKRRRDESHGN